MNEIGQTLNPIRMWGTTRGLSARDTGAALKPGRRYGAKSFAGMIAAMHQDNRVEERVWFVLALCMGVAVGLSVWL